MEDEGKIAGYLIESPTATRDQIARATGIAPAHVSSSQAWKAHKARRDEIRRQNRGARRGAGGTGDPTTDRGREDDD